MFNDNRNKELSTNSKVSVKQDTGKTCDNTTTILGSPEILTGLSHEVRTYMNSIVAFSFLQSNDQCNTAERQEYTNHVLNSCDQLINLFDNFLDSALLESEEPYSVLAKSDLNLFLQDLSIELNSSLSRFDKDNVSLVLEEQPSKEEVYIEEEKIIRVITNLFHNALEHTNSGYIKLGYTKRDGQIVFYVIDSGNGYNLNKVLLSGKTLAKRYVTNNNTFTTLGLILAQKLVNNMGGDLWIETNGVNGSGIYFSIKERKVITRTEKDFENIKSRIAI
ncbi:MAG: HAMP domain-containing sensor histidine kinase [Bacteroidales bacterium]|nr:HAMP domain-containing sensor histidine kinase [Bacteroidales bacterium]